MDGITETLIRIEFQSFHFAAAAAAALLCAASLYLGRRSLEVLENARLKRRLFLLRAAAVLLAALFAFQPVLSMRKMEKKRRALEVLLDASPSMFAESRFFDKGRDFIARNAPAWEKLGSAYDLRFSLFSADSLADSVAGHPFFPLSPFREVTSLEEALRALEKRDPAGVVLVSDGHFKDRFASRFGLDAPLFEKGEPLSGCRVYPLALSQDSAREDIAIAGVDADEFAYVKNLFTVRLDIRSDGLSPRSVPVRIKRGNEVVANTVINLKKGVRFYKASLEMAPEKVGYFIYSASLPAFASERNLSNNRYDFALKVIRDRIRVMHICGRPSWDTRFLRQTLKNDPAVDLVAFYILRTVSDYVNASTDELSLIEFPYQQLFERELHTFDLVIFQNFSYRTFFPPFYLENLRRFVENGGAFIMIGGDLSFYEGGYQGTALETVLPHRLAGSAAKSLLNDFTLSLTGEGRDHAVTGFLEGSEPFSLEGVNRMGEAQEGAAILMATNAGAPFFSVREVKKGRTAAIAGDGLWAANFASVGAGRGNRAYQELVRRTIRWLVKDPAVGSIFFSGLRAEYNAASPVSFSVKASQVKKGSELCVKLINAQDRIVEQKRIRPAKPGALAVEFRNPGEGAYVVQAEAVKGGTVEDYASESFSVSLRGEYGDGVNLPLLSALAEQSGGRLLPCDGKDLAGRIDAPAHDASRVIEERLFPLWNSVWGLCGLVLLFALEWFFRKRSGLL